MRSTLHLNLHRRFFADIAAGTRHIEYCKRSPYWNERLENRNYDVIQFRNGYATEAPEMVVEFRGLRKLRRKYQILLGRVRQIKRWKPPKPTTGQLARARAYINSMDWKFAKSMPHWPHWYVWREDGSAREFDFIDRLIWEFGYADNWGDRTRHYLVIGEFKYWVIEDCLNRAAPLSNTEFRRRGLRYCARHAKKIGPYGRLINDSTMKRKPAKNKIKQTKDTWHDLGERVYDLPNTRTDMRIKLVKRAVAKFLRDDISPDQIHFTPKGVYLCKQCRQKTDVHTLKKLI